MKRIVPAVVAAICMVHASAHAERIALATGGKPAATIVVPDGAAERVAAAAAELQRYVERVVGVKLPIARDGKRVDGTGLYIGRCEPTTEADLPGAGLNPETYAIRVREGDVFFTGRRPTPTWFAVVSFIVLLHGDFEARPATKGWSTWTRVPRTQFEVVEGGGRNGSTAAAIAGAESACYLRTVPAEPGERHLCMAWAKADPPGSPCGGKLTVRLRDRKGSWHPRRDLEPSVTMVDGPDDWQPMAVLVTIPEDGGAMVVMLGTAGQASGARAMFDDVTLYKLPPSE